MKTSDRGILFIEHFEGVALRAYRDVGGIWTIGAGLTAASGVVEPCEGMEITAQEATDLLAQALRGYEAAVAKAMPFAKQHEFDAGVSFHFNTGKIDKCSWVHSWRNKRSQPQITKELCRWNKVGRRVLKGLKRRRAAEAALLLRGDYGPIAPPSKPTAATGAATSQPGVFARLMNFLRRR